MTTYPAFVNVLKSVNERKLFMEAAIKWHVWSNDADANDMRLIVWLTILEKIETKLEHRYIIVRKTYWGETAERPQNSTKTNQVTPIKHVPAYCVDNVNERNLQNSWRSRHPIVSRFWGSPELKTVVLLVENNRLQELTRPQWSYGQTHRHHYKYEPGEAILIN